MPAPWPFDGAVVNTGTVAGRLHHQHQRTVEHDCRLGDNVHVAPGATISGGVTIGSRLLRRSRGDRRPGPEHRAVVCIGAGSVVTADMTVAGTYVGAPPGGPDEAAERE